MIKVKNLTKDYGALRAVDNISFNVKKGEIVGFLGPNGAGKTTTMQIITCFMPQTSGTVTVGEYDVFENSLDVRRQIGYMPENVSLYNDMRVNEYLIYRAKLKEVPRSNIKKRFNEVVEQCSLGEVKNRIIGQLSKGYKQRVGLGAALIGDPKVLVLDEPTIGLDPNQIREIRNLIKSLGSTHTIILSSHILPEVESICQRIIIINKGKIVAMDTTENLSRQIQGEMTIKLQVRGEGEKINRAIKSIRGIEKITWSQHQDISDFLIHTEKGKDLREDLSCAVTSSGGIIRELRAETMKLEDIFVHITT